MKCDYNSIEQALNDPHFLANRIIFLTGRSATGKTTFAKLLENHGFVHIDNDELLKIKVNPVFNLTQAESIAVIHGKAQKEVEDMFIDLLHEEMEKVPEDKRIVIDGTLSSRRILDRMFSGKFSNFTFVYLYPVDKEKYSQRVRQRFAWEVENNKQYLPIWNRISPEVLETYKKEGFEAPIVAAFMEDLIEALYQGGEERYRMFVDMGLKVVTIAV